MAKVKPYLITVKYLGVYSEPPPTIEQVAAELNIDPLEIHIEEAIVTVVPKIIDEPPAIVVPAPTGKPTKADKIRRNLMPFDTTDLDSNGPSVKILAALYKTPRTQRELREVTDLSTPTVATTISRLKIKGRVQVHSTHPTDGAVYAFVK